MDAVQHKYVDEVVSTAEILGSSAEHIAVVEYRRGIDHITDSEKITTHTKKTDWMNRNYYVMLVPTQPDWIVKAKLLTSITSDGILSSDCKVYETLLSLISGK